MRFLLLLVIPGLCLVSLPAPALSWQGEVTGVREANSLVIRADGREHRVRLYAIGVPEADEPFARKARSFVSKRLLGEIVEVDRLGGENGITGMVYQRGASESINEEILRNGLGWVHDAYCEKAKLCGRLTDIEGEARREKVNLWAKVPENKPAWRWVQEEDDM